MTEQPRSTLATFVPDLVLDRLERGVDLPWTESLRGTLLLSDICDFTTHVEAANAGGAHSIETFNTVMRRYMDLHVRAIREHGGDILDMAGDSFLCLWPSDGTDADRAVAARSAAAAALAIQAELDGFEVSDGSPIAVRIGIASGDIELTLVGRRGRRAELLAGGPAIDAVALAERDAPRGRVAVDAATADLLGAAASTSPAEERLVVLDTLEAGVDVRPPAGLHTDSSVDAIASAQAPRLAMSVGDRVDDWFPQFRRLSIVLALVPGIRDQGPEAAQAAVTAFHDAIERYDGDGWATFDGKGSILVATFGAPFAAHEDDAERAVLAAVDIADAINPITPVSVGVATGRSLHGISGNAQRRAVTMAGEVVNVAARLAGSSDDRVFCDHDTATLASSRFSFAVMNPILVKGKNERVSVFRPTELVADESPSALGTRGRTDEFARLEQLVNDESGDRRTIALLGDAGMGKSALVAQLLSRTDSDGRLTLTARADPIAHSAPYRPWAGVVRQVLGVRQHTSVAETVEEARSVLADEHAALAPLLGDVLGDPVDDEVTGALSAEKRVAATASVIASLCADVADPFVLVAEDVHWFDASSLAALQAVHDHPARPRMLLTSRRAVPEIAALFDDAATETLELGLLGRAPVAELIADRLGIDETPDALTTFVFDRTNGHPFFCDELVKNLVEDGLVRVAGDKVTVGALDDTGVPSTIEGVVVSRFDRLTIDDQQCLKLAAVIGTVIDPETVSASLGSDQREQLDRLVASGMLRRTGHQVEFSHVISRDIVYGLMAHEQRAELHRAVATHLEGSEHTHPREVGHHWLNAGDRDRAVTFLTTAAESALRTGSFVDARALFDQVVELRGDPDPDARTGAMIRIGRATAAFYLGDMAGAVTDLEAALGVLDTASAGGADPANGRRSRRWRRRAPEATSGDPADQQVLLDGYQRLSQLNYLRGASSHEMYRTVMRSLELAEQLGDTNAEAWASAQLSAVSGMLGRPKQLEQYGARAVALVEDGRADRVASDVWRTIGVARCGLAQWEQALAALDQAAATQTQAGRQAGIWQTRAAIHLCAGDFENAEHEWRRAAEAGESIGNQVQVCWSRLDEIQTSIGRDQISEATAQLAAVDAEFGEPVDPLGRIEYHYTTALVRSAEGDREAAHEAAAVVMEMIESAPPSGFHWVEFCSGVVEVYLATAAASAAAGTPPPADLVAKIEHATAVLEGLSEKFWHVAPRVNLSRGLLAASQGQRSRARKLLGKARSDARRSGLEFDAARCTVLMETYADSPDRSELEAAAAVLERLGAERWRTRAANLLAG